jgi:hypothetical protein
MFLLRKKLSFEDAAALQYFAHNEHLVIFYWIERGMQNDT